MVRCVDASNHAVSVKSEEWSVELRTVAFRRGFKLRVKSQELRVADCLRQIRVYLLKYL